jgi:colanic acid/amylovoran biosynthesis glycosyltransferase
MPLLAKNELPPQREFKVNAARTAVRLAYLVSQYPAVNHTFILREIRQLRSLGCDVAVASIRAPDRTPEHMTSDEREEAARSYFIKSDGALRAALTHLGMLVSHPVKYLNGLLFALRLDAWDLRRTLFHLLYFAEAIMLGRWMTEQRLSHVHSHFTSTVALIARQIFPITVSVTIHGPAEFSDVVKFNMAAKVRESLFLCTISDFGRSQILRICPSAEWSKIHVVRLGVNPDIYLPRPFRENLDPVELITVGRLAVVKGHAILLEALDLLCRQGRNVRLRLVGDGPERVNLERAVAARGLSPYVSFTGSLAQDKVLELYRAADLFVLPSFGEGIPVVLMEAMAMEIPCIATRVDGVPELIRDGVNGILVPPADPEALAEAIARLIDDPALRRRLGIAAREEVLATYNLDRNTAVLLENFRHYLADSTSKETHRVRARPAAPPNEHKQTQAARQNLG